jgi:hypothetical protein
LLRKFLDSAWNISFSSSLISYRTLFLLLLNFNYNNY